jgi:hypothetical protein
MKIHEYNCPSVTTSHAWLWIWLLRKHMYSSFVTATQICNSHLFCLDAFITDSSEIWLIPLTWVSQPATSCLYFYHSVPGVGFYPFEADIDLLEISSTRVDLIDESPNSDMGRNFLNSLSVKKLVWVVYNNLIDLDR